MNDELRKEVLAGKYISRQGYRVQAWKFVKDEICVSSWFTGNISGGTIKYIPNDKTVLPPNYLLRDINQFHHIAIGTWFVFDEDLRQVSFCEDEIFHNSYTKIE